MQVFSPHVLFALRKSRAVLLAEARKISGIQCITDTLNKLVIKIQVMHYSETQRQNFIRLKEVTQIRT